MRHHFSRALVVAVIVALGLSWLASGVKAQVGVIPCGTDMRVLVVSADGGEAGLPAIQQALDYVGTPYTTYIASQHPSGMTTADLANGCHGLYYAVILATNVALNAADLATLTTYETTFSIRQVTWYTWPTPDLGFNWAVSADDSPTTLLPTPAGAQVFSYLNTGPGSTPVVTQYSYTYHATPLDASTVPLLTDADGHALAAVHTFPDGRENLAMTFDSNPYLIHAMVLSYGVVNWVTRGLFIGDRHVYMSPQVDDLFIDNTIWQTTTPCGTNVDNTSALQRSTGADLTAFANWQASKRANPITADLKVTMAFNGIGTTPGYSLTVGGNDIVIGGSGAPAEDTLTPAAAALQSQFLWVSHTWDHENLDAISYASGALEITQNNAVATQLALANYSTQFLVQPDVSGLGNQQFLQAAYDNGIRYLLSNTSVVGGNNPSPNIGFYNVVQPGIFVIPRRANNLFFNVTTPADWVAEYNCLYYYNPATRFFPTPQTYAQVLDFIANEQLGYLLRGELDPWMYHQPNLAAYDGTHSLLGDLLDTTIAKYSGYFNVPILSPSINQLGSLMANRTVVRNAGVTATIQPGVGVVVSSPANVTVPITGLHLAGAEWYGGQWISWVPLTAGVPVTLPLSAAAAVPSPTMKTTLSSDGLGAQTTPAFNVVPGEVLVAFVSADGPNTGTQTATVTGGGLAWSLVKRVNTQRGTSEIWSASAAAAAANVTVTSTLLPANFYQSLTVVTFTGAAGIGASATANAATGGPSVTLITTKAGSVVYGVGNDWDNPIVRTVGPDQTKVHEYLPPAGDTFWVQNLTSPVLAVGASARIFDTAPTTDRWNFASVEITPSVVTVPGPVANVAVPNVVNMVQATAVSTLTTSGLLSTATTAASPTVPLGQVISQLPTAGTLVAPGSTVALVVSTGPAVGPIQETPIYSDGAGTRSASVSTAGTGRVLIALVSADGPANQTQQTTVAGGGLTWTLVRRVNAQRGASEIWTATAAAQLANAVITSTPQRAGFQMSLAVIPFSGASGVGASAVANAATGAPTVSLVTTRANSLVYAVGNDWDNASPRTVGANQTLLHQVLPSVGDTFWMQFRNGSVPTLGTTVQMNDTAPTNERWNLAAVEIRTP